MDVWVILRGTRRLDPQGCVELSWGGFGGGGGAQRQTGEREAKVKAEAE